MGKTSEILGAASFEKKDQMGRTGVLTKTQTYRTHFCGQADENLVGQSLKVAGWVHKKRDHGGLLFVDFRDHTGLLQCVVQEGAPAFKDLESASLETVLQIEGTLEKRTPETENPDLPTGKVELRVQSVMVLSKADPLPLSVNSDESFPEDTRLRYRFLDMRRQQVQDRLLLRSAIIQKLRDLMTGQGFVEVQTPILTSSSPEGARDFLVPSRLHPGTFYALPQAPQQFKQLLIAGGIDRYFQIAPCFRDEDARKDRSPGEFYQLDLEMAFATQEDVFAALEPVLFELFQTFAPNSDITPAPFPRIPYDEAMRTYGSDKPDLRNPLRIQDVSSLFENSPFDLFRKAVAAGKVVRAIKAPKAADRSRKFFDNLTAWIRGQGAGGLAYLVYEDGELKGPLAKFFDDDALKALSGKTDFQVGDVLFFVCELEATANTLAGALRQKLGEALGLIEENAYRFAWVVDFPMYERDPDTKKIVFSHNPFSMPQGGMEALETQDPLTIKAYQYDIVVNGIELSSGAIRNHLPDVMTKAFAIAGYPQSEVEQRFGALFRAFKYGVPPHGGSAPGIDRIVMLLAGADNLREVIPFPLNQRAQDPLMGAPLPADPARLRELCLALVKPPKA